MDAKMKEKWVKALRSKKYKQGMGGLKAGDSFCCLGVLCDVSKLGIWEEGGTYCAGSLGAFANFLSRPFMEKIGMAPGEATTLIDLNDNARAPFPDIAAYVEKHL